MTYALGIDIGTTFTAAAVWQDGRSTVLPLGRRSDAVPTVIALRDDGELLVGDAAERRAFTDPTRVARAFKRRIGDSVPIHLGDQQLTAAALTGTVLRWVVAESTARMGGPPAQTTLTHPADWTSFRIQLLEQAAADSGLFSVNLIVEPVAAATYYAMRTSMAAGEIVGVYDLGGGTFDASLVQKTPTGFQVYGKPTGDGDLGGLDIDEQVMRHVITSLGDDWSGIDVQDPDTLTALATARSQVTLAKEALSDDVDVSIPVVLPGLVRQVRLTRSELEYLASPTIDRTVDAFASMLDRNKLTADHLQAVLLVGGTSRMPFVSQRLTAVLRLPVTVDEHPKYAVCLGAATLAAARLQTGPNPADRTDKDDEHPEPTNAVRQGVGATTLLPPPPVTPMSAAGRPSVSLIANLAQTGLTNPNTIRLLPLPPARRPVPSPKDKPLVLRTTGHSRRAPKILAMSIALVIISGITIFLLTRH